MKDNVKEIIDRALDGKMISSEEIRDLFLVPEISEEAYHIQFVSRKISETLSRGKAEIHAQVGINVGHCPKNCAFCSFAAVNKIFQDSHTQNTEDIISQCLKFEQEGANAVYLMATANFSFAEYLRIGEQVKQALKPETVLVANVGDFDEAGAQALKKAGFTGIYHAVRLGEGIKTLIDPKVRIHTVNSAKKAGLLAGTCLEPVGPEHSVDELVEKTLIAREMVPVFSGSARRISVPNTELERFGMVSESHMALILAVVRLAMGPKVSGNCTHEPNGIGAMAGANLFWAENGANPRDIAEKTETARGATVAQCRKILREAGWDVLEGPSRMFTLN